MCGKRKRIAKRKICEICGENERRNEMAKKTGSVMVLCLILLVGVLVTPQAQAAGTLTVTESLKAFAAAEERFLSNIARFAPWDKMGENDVLPLDPVSDVSIGFRPLLNLGTSKDSMELEKDSYGWKSVTYDERGNKFRIVCESNYGDSRNVYDGTYDPASDHLMCRLVRGEGSSGKIWENLEFEYMKTDFGYVARFYSVPKNVIHKLAIKGDEGIVSWGEIKFDTIYASMDYPKEGRAWYEISGNRFVIQPWNGKAREYKIKK
jgi:hypothetical protein